MRHSIGVLGHDSRYAGLAAAILQALSAFAANQVEIVLKLHQQAAFAFEDTACVRTIFVVSEDTDILKHQRILIGPRRREDHIGKQLPGVAVRVVNGS